MRLTLIILFLSIFCACGGEDTPIDQIIIPSNLVVSISNPNDGSGNVSVTATADNAFHYDFYFGEGTNEVVREDDGSATYTYSKTGTYTIEVRALGNGIEYSSHSQSISVTVDELTGGIRIPTTGYTTPDSYDGWTLVWQDEFSAATINESFWTFEYGNNGGWGNNELQYYKKENASIINGNLVIEAKKETFGGKNYTSTRMITKGKKKFKYGRVDIRANLPKGQGIWPALWMLGENIGQVGWPKCGEIDIMELVGGNASGRDNTVHGTAHWYDVSDRALYGGSKTLSSGIYNDEFHVFSIIWDESSIKWLMDGNQYHIIDTTPERLDEFREEFFFIFNIAVGGDWPGSPSASTVFPQYMIVDYIRMFQKN